MRRVELFLPGNIVHTSEIEGASGRFTATGGDPQIIIKPPMPLQKSWYAIELDGEISPASNVKLYFDLGRGFSEQQAARLWGSDGRYTALVRLHKSALLIRLDPQERPGEFAIRSLSARRLSGVELTARRAAHLARAPRHLATITHARSGILATKGFVALEPANRPARDGDAYRTWIDRHDYDPVRHRAGLVAAVAKLEQKPLISVLMPVYNTPAKLLDEAIASVVAQVYPHWELCIADDRSMARHVRKILAKWSQRDKRIKVVHRPENGHIARATNSAFELASGEWIALLDHDDVLSENALAEVALTLARRPDAQLVYSDEDKIDGHGTRFEPHFKCDYSPELFRSMNYFNHLTVHRADNVRAVGGWRPGFEGSQDYDLNLRVVECIDPGAVVHIPKVLYHWRAVEGSTALAGDAKGYAYKAGWKALEEHVARSGIDAELCEIPGAPWYRVRHRMIEPAPLVSLIIPTRDNVELLRTCISSILEKTTYRNYEIVVMDNGSVEAETLAYFDEIARDRGVRVIPYPHAFNYSAINNEAVLHAKGSIVALVNNDIEVISPDWLSEMVSWVQQSRVGCVGAKLLYPDDTIQHAGIILGIGGVAGHSHKYARRGDHGYCSRLEVAQNLSAVTGACLLVRREVFTEVGGLDEKGLKVAFNDVDFCLKVREAGYLNVWTPFAELYHHESKSRGAEDTPEKRARFRREVETMQARWGAVLQEDPYYSANLTREWENFSLLV
jgi:GT2 family glycosyltransferase